MNVHLRMIGWAALAALLAAATACNRAQARVVPELPPLDVPAPPPRVVEVVVPEPPPPDPEPQLPVQPAPPKPRPSPVQQRTDPKPEPAKVESAPAETPRPPEAGRAQAGTLQTTPAGREAQLERTINDLLSRAGASLGRIDYATLNADARTQYDQAKRFIAQAQDALRVKNLVFAENLADKANTLATQLAGR